MCRTVWSYMRPKAGSPLPSIPIHRESVAMALPHLSTIQRLERYIQTQRQAEFEFVGAWTDRESFVGLTRELSPEKPIRLEAYSTVTIVLPPRQREPFSKVSIRQSVALDPKKSHAQAHFFSACTGNSQTGVWVCDRVPAGLVSIVRQVFDPATKKFHSEELASLRVSPASKMDLRFDGDASLYGKLQVDDEKLATMVWSVWLFAGTASKK